MLVGVVPFSDPSPTSVALQHITEPPPKPRSINPDLPPEAERVLLKALEKAPQDRYQTGSELMNALNSALEIKPAKAKAPLPPLPVGVPTIASRPFSKESVTKRVAATLADDQKPLRVEIGSTTKKNSKKPKKGAVRAWLLFFGLLFLATIGFAWIQGWFQPGAFSRLIPLRPAESTPLIFPVTLTPTATETSTVQPEPTHTQTVTSSPTVIEVIVESTDTPTSTSTLSPSPTGTDTPVPTNTSTASPTVTPTRTAISTSPPGHQLINLPFTIYYNENSLYFLNQSNITRSISAFTFERLNDQDEALNFFGGWDWGFYYPNITPDRCMAIELYLSPPFLRPAECRQPYLSKLGPLPDDDRIFWTAQENSSEFRVLWEGEEIGRCQIGAGVCEVFAPYYPP